MMLSFSGEKARLNCSQARLRRRKFAKYVQVIGGCGGCGAQKWQKVSKGNFINGHKKDYKYKGSLQEVLKMQNSDWRFYPKFRFLVWDLGKLELPFQDFKKPMSQIFMIFFADFWVTNRFCWHLLVAKFSLNIKENM